MSSSEYQAFLLKQQPANAPRPVGLSGGESLEGDLHQKVIDYCNSQFPKWKYRHARMDKRTTEELGVEDFTIFMPGNKTLHLELKRKGSKLSVEQDGWKLEQSMNKHHVFVADSFELFLDAVNQVKQSP